MPCLLQASKKFCHNGRAKFPPEKPWKGENDGFLELGIKRKRAVSVRKGRLLVGENI